jgi:hypothetical protein
VASTIGIKIANGEFYSIIDENSSVKKRLVLTTVHDNQRNVQIDLYKSAAKTMADALYIGSLVVENIEPRPKGEPSVGMVISSTGEGEITADAVDFDSAGGGEHQLLTVSLKSLEDDDREYEIPDFELEQNEYPPAELYGKSPAIQEEEKKKRFPVLVVIIIGLVIIIACLAFWFFLLRDTTSLTAAEIPAASAVPATPAPPSAPPVVPVQAAVPITLPPVIQAPPVIAAPPAVPPSVSPPKPAADRTRTPAPVASYKVPAAIPRNGAPYKIRWGDTLWDISGAFYRDPWQYRRIARFNNIRNPDLIVSGTTIRIPPRN